ncbi:NAD(P)H-hydrate epimerase [Georgenia sp. SUBG003]|uniref:NAD(P)H-hydrate epimerase n=1 Tax=Georgenia sp. SUBG003 TaxID=1497974 RepID=UPI003AB3A0BC
MHSTAQRPPVVGALAAERATWPQEPVVVAVDVPSGIGVDDGAVDGPVLSADVTVTMGTAKPGLLLPPASALAGRIEVVELGLVGGLAAEPPVACSLTATDVASSRPLAALDARTGSPTSPPPAVRRLPANAPRRPAGRSCARRTRPRGCAAWTPPVR